MSFVVLEMSIVPDSSTCRSRSQCETNPLGITIHEKNRRFVFIIKTDGHLKKKKNKKKKKHAWAACLLQ